MKNLKNNRHTGRMTDVNKVTLTFYENKVPVFDIPTGSTWVSMEQPPRTFYHKPNGVLPDRHVTGRSFARFFRQVPELKLVHSSIKM